MKHFIIWLFVLLTVPFWSCNSQNNEETARHLIGRWEVEQALRNGNPTESLAELYFEFTPDQKLRTNIAGVPEEGTYELRNEQLLQRNTQLNADYTIEEIADSTLVLRTELRGYAFRFSFKKAATGGTEAPQPQ
jgi:hypothetical protein